MKLLTARLYSPAFAVFFLIMSVLYSGYTSYSSYGVTVAHDETYANEVFSMEGGVLWEDEKIKITSWGIAEDRYSIGLSLDFENKTDTDLTVRLSGFTINGWVITTYFLCDVPAGRITAENIIFEENDMDMAGIDEISQIKLQFYIYNQAEYESNYLTELITIGNGYDYSVEYEEFEGITLYDENGIKIVLPEIDYSAKNGPRIPLYIENNTNKTIMINLWALEINGIDIECYYGCDLLPNTVYIGYINNFENYTETYGIEKCTEITFDFQINSFDFKMMLNPKPITVTLE